MSSAVTAKLEERGYWRLEVRPTRFSKQHVQSIRDLQRVIEKSRVQFRGWDFPHIRSDWGPPESQEWVGVETDWSSHVEVWRAFRSGQFVFRGGVWTDWADQRAFGHSARGWKPGQGMPLVTALWTITEFWEFAARYSQTEAGDDPMFVEVSFHKLDGRVLFGDHDRRMWFDDYGPARLQTFVYAREIARQELLADAAKIARSCTAELFSAFNYEASDKLLESVQAELLEMRHG